MGIIIKFIDDMDKPNIEMLNNAQKDFKLSSFDNKIIDRIVYNDDGTPIAYGIVKKMAEAILLVNPSAPLLQRAQAMRLLMHYAEYGTSKAGCNQLHCFVKSEKLAASLEKHFGFIRTKDIVLVKNL